ncbi:telomere zinc finger-associated protein-like isoform X21 [Pectinophora gossypiella]|uniref:telomere zinc finger-associated protein-like isoform X21 n=1 Tax=Pectinophora gossypiella TaxID=13191 RepID=UPI00214E0D29|nr:telomere zinc finger-associated protein-like isoform X21 [Pectinophora gossypiella]
MTAKSSDWRPGPSVCRCCFAEGCYKDISTEYFWMGKREVYQEMLSTTFDVSISYAQSGGPNSNSRLICEPCIARLRDASDFKRQVQECERVFHQHLDPTSSVSELEAVVVEPPGKEVKLERVKVESKLSDDEDFDDHAFVDDDDDDLDDQPLTALATKVPKKESVDLMDLLDNAKPEKRKAAAKPKTPPAKKAKKKESPKPSASKPAPKPVEKKRKGSAIAETGALGVKPVRKLKENVCDRQMRRRRRANNEMPEESEKRITKTMMRRNAMILLENSTAWAFRWLKSAFYCSYCDSRFVDVVPFRDHMKQNHINELPTKKIFAKLTENNMAKVDIGDLKCRICSCPLESIDSLKDHLSAVHNKTFYQGYNDGILPFKLEPNGFYCQKCYEHFLTFAKLNEHINIHYRNHICDLCGKSFVSNTRFRVHVQSHEIGSFPCGDCGEVLTTRAARTNHRTKVHRNRVRYSCPRCAEVFSSYYARCKHLVDEHAEAGKEYNCTMCAKTFLTSSQRAGHMRCTHKVTEKKFACAHCKWSFVCKYKLQRHLKTHGLNLS